MKAIVQTRYGEPDGVLEFRDIEPPSIGENEVLVRNRASAVDIGDWLIMRGLPYFARPGYGLRRPKHPIPGSSVAGRVEEVGRNVTRFRPGDEVFGWCTGGFAELVAVAEAALATRPPSLTEEAAAAIPGSGFAALQSVRDAGKVRPGSSVLIVGASGGVGTLAVQIAKALGAEVTGVGGTEALELMRSLGADDVIDYARESIEEHGRRYDVIVDLAGNRPVAELRRSLSPNGTLVLVGGSGGNWFMGFGRTVRAVLVSPFVRGQRIRAFFAKRTTRDLLTLRDLTDAGRLVPAIDRTFPLPAAADALDHVGSRHSRGKTILTV